MKKKPQENLFEVELIKVKLQRRFDKKLKLKRTPENLITGINALAAELFCNHPLYCETQETERIKYIIKLLRYTYRDWSTTRRNKPPRINRPVH